MTQTGPRCTACHRRADTQPICDTCRADTRRNLYRIPTLLVGLAHHLAARTPNGGASVGRGGFSARPPANTQALTLAAAPTATVLELVHTTPTPPARHALSIPTWITTWATVWRTREGHHPPPARRIRVLWEIVNRRTDPDGDELDVLAHDWDSRFGAPGTSHTTRIDLRYLTVRFDDAADRYDDTAAFVRQLTLLVGTASATVGEPLRAVYLGDCPEPVIDRDTGTQEVDEDGVEQWCGARIIYRADTDGRTVTCPRCHTCTPERSWYHLAYRMRTVWGRVGDREAWGQ